MVDSSKHQRVNQHVWRIYPEFKGVYPVERTPSGAPNNSTSVVLTYKTRVALPGGKQLSRWVKVNVSSTGEILKISSSK